MGVRGRLRVEGAYRRRAGGGVRRRPRGAVYNALGPGRRVDGLPEDREYRDTGCVVFPRCLECPLPVCRYDVVGGARAVLRPARSARVRELRAAGAPWSEVAAVLGVSLRTAYRLAAGVESAPRLRSTLLSGFTPRP